MPTRQGQSFLGFFEDESDLGFSSFLDSLVSFLSLESLESFELLSESEDESEDEAAGAELFLA